MTAEDVCEVVTRARSMAFKRGLDPAMVNCDRCGGEGCCYHSGENNTREPADVLQDARLATLEGQRILNKFYGRIEKSLQIMRSGQTGNSQ